MLSFYFTQNTMSSIAFHAKFLISSYKAIKLKLYKTELISITKSSFKFKLFKLIENVSEDLGANIDYYTIAIKSGKLSTLKWIKTKNKYIKPTNDTFKLACCGKLKLLKWLDSNFKRDNESIGYSNLFMNAIQTKNLDVLNYLVHDRDFFDIDYIIDDLNEIEFSCYRVDSVECLKWFDKLIGKNIIELEEDLINVIIINVCRLDAVNCLSYYHELGVPYSENCFYNCFESINCMKLIIKNKICPDINEDFSKNYLLNAVTENISYFKNKYYYIILEIFKYLYECGFKTVRETPWVFMNKYNYRYLFDYIKKTYIEDVFRQQNYKLMVKAISFGSLNDLKFLNFYNITKCSKFTLFAIKFNNLKILKWLHNNGYNWNDLYSYSECIKFNRIKIAKYLYKNDAKLNESLFNNPFITKDMLKFLIINKCPGWEKKTESIKKRK